MLHDKIELLFVLAMTVVGISHVAQARLWTESLRRLLEHEHGAIVIALYSLPVGAIFALGGRGFVLHAGALVTVYGWLLVIKSAIYLWNPGVARRFADKDRLTESRCRLAGCVMLVLGVVVALGRIMTEQG